MRRDPVRAFLDEEPRYSTKTGDVSPARQHHARQVRLMAAAARKKQEEN